jgi:copper resistance protein C
MLGDGQAVVEGRARSMTYILLTVVIGVLFVAGAGAPAMAHNSLASSDPKDGARLAKAPAAVRLTFLAKLDPQGTRVTITDPSGARAEAGRPAFNGRVVTLALRAGVAGVYTVAYQVPSSDGHPVKGKVRFTLTVGATPSSPPAPASSLSPSPSPSHAEVPVVATSETEEGGTTWWPWAVGGVLLAVAAVVAVAARLRRRTG